MESEASENNKEWRKQNAPAAVPEIQHEVAQEPHVRVLHVDYNKMIF